jgi:hypothetical protein
MNILVHYINVDDFLLYLFFRKYDQTETELIDYLIYKLKVI